MHGKFASNLLQMYRFSVHGVRKSIMQPCLWVLVEYTFGHKDLQTCQIWVDRINASLNLEVGRPKNLLVCFTVAKFKCHFLILLYFSG